MLTNMLTAETFKQYNFLQEKEWKQRVVPLLQSMFMWMILEGRTPEGVLDSAKMYLDHIQSKIEGPWLIR
jgi:hypothetical protein